MDSDRLLFHVTKEAFFCEESPNDVDGDGFNKGVTKSSQKWIKSINNEFLILNEDNQFELEDRTTDWQECHPEHKFSIQVYNVNKSGRYGRAVMLYVNQGDKRKFLCCNDKYEIYPEEMNLPISIEEDTHKAIWYRKQVTNQTSWYTFESSLYRNRFLGLESERDGSHLSKLFLCEKDPDEVDNRCIIIVT